ncbi:hypothetical protein GCM10020221_11170 [Streptomyces thioluteus]|uniref:Uncharacterized protein n=1 Tax=Streptomyces thioluteus TaxID=66431 RepID=A0ABP6J157_STRTU
MASRVVFPDPAHSADQQTRENEAASDRDASWALEYLISQNAGSAALPDRRPFGYSTPDGSKRPYDKWGSRTAYSHRFDNLRMLCGPWLMQVDLDGETSTILSPAVSSLRCGVLRIALQQCASLPSSGT